MTEPAIDSTASVEMLVGESDLASHLSADPRDQFPAVFATARMVALMELASARLLQPFLRAGELSVGVSLEVSHTAATPVGVLVTAVATYKGRAGKLFSFEVVASDQGGEIGRSVHKRAIVSTERLLSGSRERNEGPNAGR